MDRENEYLTIAKKPPPRKGRRAVIGLLNSREDDKPKLEVESRAGTSSQASTSNQPMPPPRARRAGGWANEDSKSKKKLPSSSLPELLDNPKQRFQSMLRTRVTLDSDDELPDIPELDYSGGDVSKPGVNYKKLAAMKRLATYKELDAPPPTYLKLDGIDLSVLAKCLDIKDYPHIEADKIMSWDALFNDVKSKLRRDEKCNDPTGMPGTDN